MSNGNQHQKRCQQKLNSDIIVMLNGRVRGGQMIG